MSWRLGEVDLTQLRLMMSVYDNTNALADICNPAAGELLVSHTGAALANAGGTFNRIGQGAFYYQGVAADAAVEGFTMIQLVKAGFDTAIAYSMVVGDSGKIWIPLVLYHNGNLVTGINPNVAGELQMSPNGIAWEAATGTFHEIGNGAYYYLHDVANLSGFLGIKVTKLDGSCDEALAWGSSAGIVAATPPPPVGVGSRATGSIGGIGFWSV